MWWKVAEAHRKSTGHAFGRLHKGRKQGGCYLGIAFNTILSTFFSECRFLTQLKFPKLAPVLSVTLPSMVETACTIDISLPSRYSIYLSFSGLQTLSLHWASVPLLVPLLLITGPWKNLMTSHHFHSSLRLEEPYGKCLVEPYLSFLSSA